MVFSSLLFLLRFLPTVLLAYYIAPKKCKNFVLFVSSLIFYAWGEPVYVALILISTLVDYFAGRAVAYCRIKGYQKRAVFALLCSVIINLSLLGFFKYGNFLLRIVHRLTGFGVPVLHLALPIGISFYTFQTMSYTIDVYRGEAPVQKNLISFGAYVSLFPQLIAGPIIRYKDVAEQLRERRESISLFSGGITRFMAGMGKKVLIANPLWMEIAGMNTGELTTATAWLGVLAFTFQIYFDFSGYSDMAIGLGRMFGFSFPENFNYPYESKSITEFWRRWHISLATWFRDYIYIPLGGSRRGNRSLHILIVFFITGLWHGASWNFILWGMMYGVLLVIEKPLSKTAAYEKIPSFFKWALTMLIVMTGWVLFRAANIKSALKYILMMYGIGSLPPNTAHFSYAYYLDARLICTLIAAFLASVPVFKQKFNYLCGKYISIRILQIILAFLLLVTCIIYIANSVYNPFIYFQF